MFHAGQEIDAESLTKENRQVIFDDIAEYLNINHAQESAKWVAKYLTSELKKKTCQGF